MKMFNRKIVGKKAISPLIATILLVAFAVALGSVVYTYFLVVSDSSSYGINSCSNYVFLEANKDSSGNFYYDFSGNQIIVNLLNKGTSRVVALNIVVEGSDDNLVLERKSFVLNPGISKKLRIEYNPEIYGSIQRIIITPYYVKAGEKTICTDSILEIFKEK